MARLTVYNPLPVAYTHREAQLLATIGDEIDFVRTENEGLSRFARLGALVRHVRAARRLRLQGSPVLVTWPLLGWLELVLWSSRQGTTYLSVHDPKPLRPQIGLGRFSAWLARRVPAGRRPHIIAHSSVASEAIAEIIPGSDITVLPLPMLPQAPSGTARRRRVLVLGQYKPARDLDILVRLAPPLKERGIECVIAGRGWPQVEGWRVNDAFLTEEDFDAELAQTGCLLVPYQHYFQSGVAARAVELGTRVVGAAHPFLSDSLALRGTEGIVLDPSSTDEWIAAITASIDSTALPLEIFADVRSRWHRWADSARVAHA